LTVNKNLFIKELSKPLYFPALYSLNTGARMSEMTELRWSWEIKFPTLNISAFRIPAEYHKNGKPKLVVLNSIASKIVEQNRGRHPEHVFTYLDRNTHELRPIKRLGGSCFQRIRKTVGLGHVVFHDFRTTFSTRLGGYDVSKDTISILMGHTIAGVTADYAFRTTIVESLVAAVDNLVERKTFTFVQANENLSHTKVTQTFNFISDAKNEASKSLERLVKYGRDERIRTSDHSTPSRVRYQTALHPVF
jgi:integrase